ncbi:MAG: CPBP family intramembrane metalloprotease [Treponema sp.]|nr:CPBP family intramembrane metalloprotease [Treponema sp.]
MVTARPRLRDAGAALAGLVLTGAAVSAAASFSGYGNMPAITPPEGLYGWAGMLAAVFSAAWLEEAYFRAWLPLRLRAVTGGPWPAHLASAAVFSLCHVYEGPWGFVNAAAAGIFLAAVMIRTRSLHGIALAHGAYNALVFVYAAFTARP